MLPKTSPAQSHGNVNGHVFNHLEGFRRSGGHLHGVVFYLGGTLTKVWHGECTKNTHENTFTSFSASVYN